ncbi:hypothetical protein FRC09_013753 [Ceratobasidium sp. 395]|nr:hypothetical protein FRC09_013753 [Ceratobasidium sp. 395]
MSGTPQEILGKKLDDYLLHDYNPNELPSDSLLQHLDSDRTIKKILAKENVTATTLYDLTRLVLAPSRLLSFQGTQIMPVLMDLFRTHIRRHHPYEYEYGFHCVEAILFSLMMGVLSGKPGVFQAYVGKALMLSGQASAASLHNTMDQCLGPTLKEFKEIDEHSETFWGFDPLTRTLVPALGGFTVDDLYYFIDAIWKDRNHMLWAHTITGVSALWRCGITVLCLFHRRTSRNRGLLPKIYNLALRLELNSSEDEFQLLDIALDYASQAPPSSDLRKHLTADIVTDTEDAKLMLRKYPPWVILLEQRNWNTLNYCVLSASGIVMQLDDLELHLEFLRSHLRVIWSGIYDTMSIRGV